MAHDTADKVAGRDPPPERAGGLAGRIRRWFSPAPPARAARPRRPDAPSVLVVRPSPEVFADLADRLAEDAPEVRLSAATDPAADRDGAVALPAETTRRAALRWIADTGANLVVWTGALSPDPLLQGFVEAGQPMIAVDVPTLPASEVRSPAARRALRNILGHARVSFARDEEARRSLRVLAPAGARIEAVGPVRAVPRPPPCNSAERDQLAQVFHARPVWLAAAPLDAEVPAILAAHRFALHGAHRLLLIVTVPSEESGAALVARLRTEGWRAVRRSAEGEPDDTVEVFVADTPEEIGLWYRLAPITFLGGTLAGGVLPDPSGPASLGSAIVAGPHLGTGDRAGDASLLGRLAGAGGLVRIASEEDLGTAIGDLMAPDRAAARAHAAWDVVSDGARVQDRIVDEIRDALRAQGA